MVTFFFQLLTPKTQTRLILINVLLALLAMTKHESILSYFIYHILKYCYIVIILCEVIHLFYKNME